MVMYLAILCFTDTAAILILPPGHPIIIIEINIFHCEQLISMIIMGCPGRKINMAAVSAKLSMGMVLEGEEMDTGGWAKQLIYELAHRSL